MPWVDSDYYQNDYMPGRSPVIPVAEFPGWEKQAEYKINWKRVTMDDPPDYLKDCVCAVAERMYAQSLAQGVQAGGASPVTTGFSNDGYSEQFLNTLSAYQNMSKAEVDREIAGIASEYLSGTPLHNQFCYRGIS